MCFKMRVLSQMIYKQIDLLKKHLCFFVCALQCMEILSVTL